jgi:hypothetical protein
LDQPFDVWPLRKFAPEFVLTEQLKQNPRPLFDLGQRHASRNPEGPEAVCQCGLRLGKQTRHAERRRLALAPKTPGSDLSATVAARRSRNDDLGPRSLEELMGTLSGDAELASDGLPGETLSTKFDNFPATFGVWIATNSWHSS